MNIAANQSELAASVSFDVERLDQLMEKHGIDLLLTTSKHNVQYLLGGHRAIFFEYMDSTGLGRYMPVLVYPKGEAGKAAYIGHRLEGFQKPFETFWTSEVQMVSAYSPDAMQEALAHVRKAGLKHKRIAIETAFLPVDAGSVVRNAYPDSKFFDAHFILERLRAVKRPYELEKLRLASELVTDSMMAVIANHALGAITAELAEVLQG